jgi:hypothetical protein
MTAQQRLLLNILNERGTVPAWLGDDCDWQALADCVKPDVIHHPASAGMKAFDEQVYVLAAEGERAI